MTSLSGRMTDVEMPINDTATIYAGAASGGVWRSKNGGKQWQAIFDQQPCLAIGDIAIAPSQPQIIYVGTGEPNGGGGSLTQDGCGIYRSDNGGEDWKYIGLPNSGSIGRIVVSPNQPNTVYIAAMGSLFADNQERGIFKTIDGGQTWQQSLYISDSTGAIDLAIHPTRPDTVFAAMWERSRRPNRFHYGGATSGLYRSYDGGKQWLKLDKGLPQQRVGRIGVAIAPSKPNRLYAMYMDSYGDLIGVFRSDDNGDSWKPTRNNEQMDSTNGYGWWFGKPIVAPDNPDRIYLPLLDIWQSDNGGNKWANISDDLIHYDQHSLFIHPLQTNLLLTANDGGIYYSRTQGKAWAKTSDLPTTQFYTLIQDPLNKRVLYGGMQDNGVIKMILPKVPQVEKNTPLKIEPTIAATIPIADHGDGVRFAISPLNPQRLFYAFQYADLYTTFPNKTWEQSVLGIYESDRSAWQTPILYHPYLKTFICATQSLYQWNEAAHRWKPWGNRADFSNGGDGYNFHYGTVTAIAISENDSTHLYCGTDDGNIWATHDGGRTFELINKILPKRWVNDMLLSPKEDGGIYVALSAYRHGKNDTTYIYRTRDDGQNWENISFNLPKGTTANKLLWLKKTTDKAAVLLAGTDKGLWALPMGGTEWLRFNDNMPLAPITDLQQDTVNHLLFIATYGRGIYFSEW